ncbi:MAG: hypothetical protein ACPMAQ_10485 [Phycisphaerae bacterium]
MAVTLTAMLAIIGSSFVLVTRLERQTVRSFATLQGMDQIQDYVIRKIQSTIAQDVVALNAGTPVDRLQSAIAGTANPVYEPWDAPAVVPAPVNGDAWLAPIEPTAHWNSGTNQWDAIRWSQGSEVFPQFNPAPIDLLNLPGNTADADGDGVPDSFLREPDELQVIDGKNVFVAVRIIDNCGMLNLNTAFGMYPAGIADGFGMLPTQLNVKGLLGTGQPLLTPGLAVSSGTVPTADNAEVWLVLSRLGGKVPPPAYGASVAEWMTNYTDWLLRFYEWPQGYALTLPPAVGGVPPPPYPAPYDLGSHARLFDINDELALRNRFLLKASSTSRIEAAEIMSSSPSVPAPFGLNGPEGLWNVIGDEPGDLNSDSVIGQRRRTPFADVTTWANTLFGDQTSLTPYHDIRHLLTMYSFDRTVRPVPQAELDASSDPVASASGKLLLGPMRQVDINAAVTDLLQPVGPGAHMRGARKLVHALRYVFAPDAAAADLAVQYVANLRDYLDADSELTHYLPGQVDAGIPSRDIFGYERQVFISEVFCQITQGQDPPAAPDMMVSAIEFCNPYDTDISLSGWKVYQGGAEKLSLGADAIVPHRVVTGGVVRPGRLIVATADGTFINKVGEPDGLASVLAVGTFKLDARSSDELKLTRPAAASGPGSPELLVDMVVGTDPLGSGGDMASVTGQTNPPTNKGESKEYSIQRGTSAWRFARNEFAPYKDPVAGTLGGPAGTPGISGLGLWLGKTHQPTGTAPGVALPVADRLATSPASPVKVAGWFEIDRPVYLGNPSQTDYQSHSGNSSYWPITEQIGPRGAAHRVMTAADEAKVRLDFADPQADPASNKARKLFEVMGFFARDDDGFNNEAGTSADKNTESLMECRIPGRINVNTAPEAVLRAVFPALADYGKASAQPAQPVALDARELEAMSIWYARAIVYLREQPPGPFRGLDDLANRLASFTNGSAGAPIIVTPELVNKAVPARPELGRAPVGPGAMWFSRLVDQVRQRTAPDTTVTGDLFMTGDFEDRDWLFGRMANLLTVRSDTFTAYILIRIQSQANPNEVSERRLIAIFDRSNVFLPPAMARNGTDNSDDLPLGTASDDRDRLYVTPRVVAVQPVPEVN